jgi:hypothetical protein
VGAVAIERNKGQRQEATASKRASRLILGPRYDESVVSSALRQPYWQWINA